MKVEIERKGLLAALKTVTSVVSRPGAATPILTMVLLSAEADRLMVSGTDTATYVRARAPGEPTIDEPGEVCVPPDLLMGALKTSAAERVQLETTGGHLRLTANGAWWNIVTEASQGFPAPPGAPEKPALSVAPSILGRLVRQSAYATASDVGRPALAGVLLETLAEQRLRLAAADGNRLALAWHELDEAPAEAVRVIVPAAALTLALEMASGPFVEIGVRANTIFLRSEGGEVAAQVLEGEFPDFDQIVPTEFAATLRAKREALVMAMRQAAVMTLKDSRAVDWSLGADPERATFEAMAQDRGEAHVEVAGTHEGEPLTVTLNPEYVVEALEATAAEDATVRIAKKVEGKMAGLVAIEEASALALISPLVKGDE